MVKTLATLAVSMTGGAVLLAWMEPQPGDLMAGRDLYGWDAFQAAAHQAVGATGGVQPIEWSAVEVLAVPHAGLGRRGTLAATTPPDDFHFLVTRQGDLQPLMPWQRQQAAGDGRRVIRVGVVGAPGSGGIPVAQRDALRALLLELAGLAGPLPVRVGRTGESLVGGAPAAHKCLRALLAEQGFVD